MSLGGVGVRNQISLMAIVAKAAVDADVVADSLDAKVLEIQHMEMKMLAERQFSIIKMIYEMVVKNLGRKESKSES